MPDHLYTREGNVYTPTEWAGSPWSSSHQHGGPVNALFARAAEAAAAQSDLQIVRLTVDLFRPVPLAPLELTWRFVRRGRKLANVEAELRRADDDHPISRASAVLLRPTLDLPPRFAHTPPLPPDLDGAEPIEFMPPAYRDFVPPGFHWSLDIRVGTDDAGPAAWISTPLFLSPDEPMSPLQRCAAVADLTSGLSRHSLLRQQSAGVESWQVPMINTDTTVYWERPPVGNWFAFRQALLTDQAGIGLAEVDLADRNGRLGRSLQALVANGPPTPPGSRTPFGQKQSPG